jgi:predicted regulator of Ras-like GTPase activity (Roadblock/LC7/MglB family)
VSFFRNLFQWRTATPKTVEPSPVPASAVAAPQVSAAQPVAAVHDAPVAAVPADAQCIPFPLKAITDCFPAELKSAIRKQPSEHVEIQIPRALIEPQLATGAVRLTFEQLRGVTPEIFFHPEAAGAETKVQLPLGLVIQKLKPARRGDQRQPSLPSNIPSVFAKTGASSGAGSAAAVAKEGWYTPRRPTYEPKPEPPVAPEPAAAAVPVPVIPEPPKPASAAAPVVMAETPPTPVVPAPVEAAPAPVAVTPPAAAEPETSPDFFSVPFQTIAPALPEDIQAAFAGIAAQTFVIPISEIEPRMRTGKLRFKWSELRGWCVPPSASEGSPDVEIDLPMATVVPLFMARRNTAAARRKVEIDSRIPDVFGKANAAPAPEPESAVPAAPVAAAEPITAPALAAPTPEPEPPAATAPEPAPTASTWESRPLRIEQITVPPETKPAEPLFTAPPVEQASPVQPEPAALPAPVSVASTAPAPTGPADAVRRIREIENVTGAFVATADGLLVAADLADGNASILAAFAPTVFSQLAKYTDMAKLGKPEAIELHLGLTTIHVRKAGKLYLGILMPPGHSFPLAAVAPISSSLQPHSN